MTRKVALALISIAGLISIAAGITGLLSTEFTPYNEVVAGRSWSQLEPSMQTVILGMQVIMGSGFLATGVAILALLFPASRGESWAILAVPVVTSANWVPTLLVATSLRRVAAEAETPIVPTAVVIALVCVGSALLWLRRD